MDRKKIAIQIFIVGFVLFVLFIWGRINGLVFGGMFGGQVVSVETEQPMAGVHVVARWHSRTFHARHCVYMDIATTDEKGEYFFPPWVDFAGHTVFSQPSPRVFAYAPGYEEVGYSEPIRLAIHDDAPKNRIEEINRVSSLFCGSGPSNIKGKMARVREKMYVEAERLLTQISRDPDGKYAYRVEFLRRRCGEPCQ